MANSDDIRFKGSGKEYKDDRGGATLIPSAVVGIVKNNIDPTRTGRLEVFINRLGTANQDNPANWTVVRYLSPFFGYTTNTGNPQAYGDYVGNPNSYGFWATPPDIGTEVLCVFLNGDPNEGFYIGSIPKPGMNHMTPGIAASESIIPNKGEAESYGGATKLPVSEINTANSKQSNNPSLTNQPRPIHSYQAAIYNKQGLLRDTERGPISSSSTRESPSRVFGMSTPGRPIYQGGYDDTSIKQAVSDSNIPDKNFQIIGRRGGHTFVMDDGDITGKDQLLRLRTGTGHTILMNDTAQTLFIIHANGQSYIELGKEGTIDMYSTNSVNIRTQGDLNLHADRNVNINAGKDLNINAENVQVESEKTTNMFTGTNFTQYTKSNHTVKVDGGMSLASTGEASFASSGTTYVNGPTAVNLNTGSSGLVPNAVKQVTKVKHTDTLYDSKKGFASAPGKLTSITSRAPAHAPWADANKGVDAKSNLSASANFPASSSPAIQQTNQSVPASPAVPTTPAVASTVPNTAQGNAATNTSTNALTSQMAVNAATNPKIADAVASTAGTVTANGQSVAVLGATGLTPTQLAATGHIKPGMEKIIESAIASGTPLEDAIPTSAWTGKDGINSLDDFLKNQVAQAGATQTLLDKSKTALVEKGLITGKESITQTGGLIMATASAGIDSVAKYMKSVSASTMSSLGSITSAMPTGTLNPTAGPVADLIAGGKLAASLADKALSGISLPGSVSSPDGVSKGLFDKITASFKPLTAGIPQDLKAINDKSNESSGLADMASSAVSSAKAALASATSKVTGMSSEVPDVTSMMSKAFDSTTAGVKNIASDAIASAKSFSENLTASAPVDMANIPGTTDIKDSIAKISGSVTGMFNSSPDIIGGLKDKLGTNTNLASFASLGLSAGDLSKLTGAINSMGSSGPNSFKLPTVAEGTNNVSELVAQSKALLGNPKIPSLSFGSASASAESKGPILKAGMYDENGKLMTPEEVQALMNSKPSNPTA